MSEEEYILEDFPSAIPEEWLRALRGKGIIEQCLFPGFEKVRN